MSHSGQNNINITPPAVASKFMPEIYSRLLSPLALACAVLLGGCAAQSAYREGRELAEAGKPTEALAKFEEASKLDSGSAQYRIAAIQTRESLVSESLTSAQRLLAANQPEDARQAYNRVLALHPNNSRALEGLRGLDVAARHEKWLSNADTAAAKKDERDAQMWARMVIAENPQNRKALGILQNAERANEKLATASVLAESYRKSITIEFKDVPLKTVFEVISRTSGMNFLFDKDVRTEQKTSIFLKNSTIEAAVSLTLLTNQLEQRVLDANTVLIYPNTQAKQKDYQPLTVRSFYLANGEAKNVASTLKTILKSRDVVVDEKLNMIILRDSPEAVRLAEKLVALHDVQEPEVMLEVEILEVKRTRLLNLGVRWPDQLTLSPIAASTGTLTVSDLRKLNSETIGANIGTAVINAKKQDSDTNILANPRIRVRNREKAKILIGERVPNISSTATSTGFVSESINYVDVGLKLDVEPTIYLDGEVAIKIALEVSSVVNQLQTKSGSVAYQIGTRTAQTVLRLRDGENQVLAGLINDEDRRTGNKVPGLGEAPILGRLFGSQADDSSKTEIVLSITPRILRNVQRPSASAMEFDSGTETSLGSRATGGVTSSTPAPGIAAGTPAPKTSVVPAPPATQAPGAAPNTSNNNLSPGTTSPVVSNVDTIGQSDSNSSVTTAGSPQLRWQGPTQQKVGDSIALQLMMQSDQPVVSLPMAVGFDARALQVTSITEGDFLKQNGAQTSFTSRVDPNGQILMTGTRAGDSGATVLGSIATINFRVIAATAPEAKIQLLTISPIALGGRGVSASLPQPHLISIAP